MKNKHIITVISIFIFVVSIFISYQATAEENSTPQLPYFTLPNRDARLLYAKTLSTFLHKIDEYIPSLSPSERTWLNEELKEYNKSKNINRLFAVQDSKEYKSDYVKKHIESMTDKLDEIIKTHKLNKEVYLWSRLTEDLMDPDFWEKLHILADDGLIDKKLFSAYSPKKDQYIFYINNAKFPATSILKNIVQPYLNGELIN
jgi:hypothetical protein